MDKNIKTSVPTNHRKELISLIKKLSHKHSIWHVFEDFLAMSAFAISNSVDWVHRESREAQYMEIVGRYDRAELEAFPEMLSHLIEELERHAQFPEDVLGRIFHELELHNKYKGQFFTPQSVCNMFGELSIGETDAIVDEKGYTTVNEPCVGSGAMVLGFAQAMQKRQYDFHRHMVVTAIDVDIKCVWMSYLQFALYGIPAVVIHGNSLTTEEWSRWYTPVYILDGWIWREACGITTKASRDDEPVKRASKPLYTAMRNAEALISAPVQSPDITLKEATNGQILFDF